MICVAYSSSNGQPNKEWLDLFNGENLSKWKVKFTGQPLGINYKDRVNNAKNFLNKLGNPYHSILSDVTGTNVIGLGAIGVPETFLVNKDFTLPNYDNIFVIGDLARFTVGKEEYLPGIAPVAMQSGVFVAELIKKRAAGKDYKKEFKYKNKGNLAVIGRNKAVADLGYFTTKGFIAWILWIFIHICYLIGFDNKASVLVKWALNYFNQDKGTRLIFLK